MSTQISRQMLVGVLGFQLGSAMLSIGAEGTWSQGWQSDMKGTTERDSSTVARVEGVGRTSMVALTERCTLRLVRRPRSLRCVRGKDGFTAGFLFF